MSMLSCRVENPCANLLYHLASFRPNRLSLPWSTLKITASTGRNCKGRAQTSPAFVSLPPPLRNRTSGFLLFLVLSLWRDNVFHLLLLRLHTSFSNVSDSAAKASVTDRINRGTPELPVQLFSSHLAGYCLCAYVSELPGHLLSDAKGDQDNGYCPSSSWM